MAAGNPDRAILRTLLHMQGQGLLTDGQLLERFAANGDEGAFEAVVWRHSALVLRVCRRVLGQVQDAEDAFQATFIVLARKARSLTTFSWIGGWLHKVAGRIALRARAKIARRRALEQPGTGMTTEPATLTDPDRAAAWGDAQPILDEELNRLPERYRLPLVLCYLEGKTIQEAAGHLHCPAGTVASRLARARDRLHGRLTRRGLALSAGALALLLSREAIRAAAPAPLVTTTARGAALLVTGKAAADFVSAPATELATELLRSLTSRKLKWAAALVVVLTGATVAAGLAASRSRPSDAQIPTPITRGVVARVQGSPFVALAFPTDDRMSATITADGAVQLWDWDYGRRDAIPRAPASGLAVPGAHATAAEFAADGTTLAVGYRDGAVRLWDPATGVQRKPAPSSHLRQVAKLCFAPDGKTLASAGHDGSLKLWDLIAHRARATIPLPESGIDGLTFSADGKALLALHRRDLTLLHWDTSTGKEKPIALPAECVAIALAPGGKSAVLARRDRALLLWDWAANRESFLFRVKPNQTLTCLVAPGEKMIFCLDPKSNRALVWEVAAARARLLPANTLAGGITSWGFSRDGRRLAVAGLDKALVPGHNRVPIALHVWPLDDLPKEPRARSDGE